ncbi:MAG: preprotein translocase subunit SecG [Parcubacteria group bacterium]
MAQFLPLIQIIISILLVAGILLQRSEAGLGSAFGGGDGQTNFNTRRGFEKLLFNGTIILAILFGLSAFAGLFIAR